MKFEFCRLTPSHHANFGRNCHFSFHATSASILFFLYFSFGLFVLFRFSVCFSFYFLF